MNITIDTDVLDKHRLQCNQYIFLSLLFNNKDVTSFLEREEINIEQLEHDTYIRNNKGQFIITDKVNDLFKNSVNTSIENIVSTLNKYSNSRYRVKSKSTQKFLNQRLQEYTEKEIIDTTIFMCKEWKNTNMDEYLRPETLYNETKFQSYYNKWHKQNNKVQEVNRM